MSEKLTKCGKCGHYFCICRKVVSMIVGTCPKCGNYQCVCVWP